MHVTVVTITYAKRWDFLRQTLQSAFSEGADRAVVIDNEAAERIEPLAAALFPGTVSTDRLEKNQGSAGAYHAAIQKALAAGAEYLLLLDDDNALDAGALATLKQTYQDLLASKSRDTLCLVAFRPDHQTEVLGGPDSNIFGKFPDAFLGFHLKELPGKIRKRLPGQAPRKSFDPSKPLPTVIARRVAPFGGLFFHRSLVERFGLPDARLVLYQDDYEWTNRITSQGGELLLVPAARISDVETSWSITKKPTNSFDGWLRLGSDRQVFYTVRNRSYLESHCLNPTWFRKVNRTVYIFILWILAHAWHRMARFQLLRRAIRDGELGQLGIHPAFPPAG